MVTAKCLWSAARCGAVASLTSNNRLNFKSILRVVSIYMHITDIQFFLTLVKSACAVQLAFSMVNRKKTLSSTSNRLNTVTELNAALSLPEQRNENRYTIVLNITLIIFLYFTIYYFIDI